MKKRILFGLFVVLGVVAVLSVVGMVMVHQHIVKPAPASGAIAIIGGSSMQVRIKTEPFTQRDTRWASDTVGSTDETLGAVGCTICATAMALTARGFPVTPAELNTKLTGKNGFTESGLLIWGAVHKITGKKHAVVVDDHPSHAKLDAQLAMGNPIIAKVLYQNRIWHWILITGKDGTDYLMNDPLGQGTAHESMTRYPSGIFTIRYLK